MYEGTNGGIYVYQDIDEGCANNIHEWIHV